MKTSRSWVVGAVLASTVCGCRDGSTTGGSTTGGSTYEVSAGRASCESGTERCPCYRNKTCDAGLTCASDLCVSLPSTGGTSSGIASSAGGAPITGSTLQRGGTAPLLLGTGGGLFAGSAGRGSSNAPVAGNAGVATATGGAVSTGGTASTGGAQWPSFGGSGIVGAATGGGSGTATVQACSGIPAPIRTDCSGVAVEAKPNPFDLVILLDRSVSNSYAVGSDSATPATGNQLTRWDTLTVGLQSFASSVEARGIAASVTFFSLNGGRDAATNCNAADYAKPAVPLGPVEIIGNQLVDAMHSVRPAGLTPTVPALVGTFQYAMAEQKKNATREKVLVFISDGYPTLCDQKAPSDVANVIKEAASAPIPIKTYVIGVGSPTTLDGAKFNLQNYARSGDTGRPPFVLDETAGAEGVQQQLVTVLLTIAHASNSCAYPITSPTASAVLAPKEVSVTYLPNHGELQEIPRVSGAPACSNSTIGGWYFDDILNPTKFTLCPCTCAVSGSGRLSLVHGCPPSKFID